MGVLTTQAFASEIVTPPTALPVTVAEAQEYARADSDDTIFERLIAAVTLETERSVLWRAIVAQQRRSVFDAPLAPRITLEPTNAIVSLTRWTDADAAEVVPADVYHFSSADPGGAVVSLRRGQVWPSAERKTDGFALTYDCGWAVNDVPAAIQHMILTAVAAQYQNIDPFAAAGVRDLKVGSVSLKAAIPPDVAALGSAYAYRQDDWTRIRTRMGELNQRGADGSIHTCWATLKAWNDAALGSTPLTPFASWHTADPGATGDERIHGRRHHSCRQRHAHVQQRRG